MHAIRVSRDLTCNLAKSNVFNLKKQKTKIMALFRNFYFTYQPTFQVLSYVTYTAKVV